MALPLMNVCVCACVVPVGIHVFSYDIVHRVSNDDHTSSGSDSNTEKIY